MRLFFCRGGLLAASLLVAGCAMTEAAVRDAVGRAAGAPPGDAPATAQADLYDDLRGHAVGDRLEVECAAGRTLYAVKGSNPYAGETDLCSAGVHAGAITRAGGRFEIVAGGARESFEGRAQNGVESMGWPGWHSSFTVVVPPRDGR